MWLCYAIYWDYWQHILLSNYRQIASIEDGICKIPMDSSKFHVMHDVILLKSTGKGERQ